MSINSNQKFEKTSFLSKTNSSFIEQMYLKYLNQDPSLPIDWKKYFEDLKEEISIAFKELEGPSWRPNKIKKYQAQEEFIEQRAWGTNMKRQGLEETQKRRDDLRELIKEEEIAIFAPAVKPNSFFINLVLLQKYKLDIPQFFPHINHKVQNI